MALSSVTQIPFGTVIDATHGSVSVTTAGPHGATQTITLSEGEFVLTQGRDGMVVVTLTGGDFSGCPTARERAHVARAASTRATGKHGCANCGPKATATSRPTATTPRRPYAAPAG